MRIGESESNPYFLDKKVEYVSLDTHIDGIVVLAICTNQSQLTKEPSKEPVKRILHWRSEKKKKYAAPKNVRFDEWEPVRENLAPIHPLVTLSVATEIAM